MARLVAVKTEPKCSICKSGPEKRAAIEAWWARRGEKEGAETITTGYICERVVPILLGDKISETSVKRHARNHCRKIEDGEAETGTAGGFDLDAETERVLDEIDALLESSSPSPTGALSVTLRAWLADTRARLARGERLNITTDQAMRAAERLVAAERQLGEADLLRQLTGGIGQWFSRELGSGSEPAGELEAGEEIVEGEVLEVEDE